MTSTIGSTSTRAILPRAIRWPSCSGFEIRCSTPCCFMMEFSTAATRQSGSTRGLEHISTAIDLSKWYMRTMGMRASVTGVAPRSSDRPWSARLGDVGPFAFRDVALVLPRPRRDAQLRAFGCVSLRTIGESTTSRSRDHVSRPSPVVIPLSRVVLPTAAGAAPMLDTAAMSALREPDGRYLQTTPGQRMTLEFATKSADRVAHADSTTTYLIAWQGWYREWIRGKWLAEPKRAANWTPNDSSVLAALRQMAREEE